MSSQVGATEAELLRLPKGVAEERRHLAIAGLHVVLHDGRAVAIRAAVSAGHIVEVVAGRVGLEADDLLDRADATDVKTLVHACMRFIVCDCEGSTVGIDCIDVFERFYRLYRPELAGRRQERGFACKFALTGK